MVAKLTLVLILACLCTCVRAAVPAEIAGTKVYKLWQFSKSAEGWRPDHNVGTFALKNGILSFTNTGNDPWIINTEIGGADTAKYGFLGIRMRSSVSGDNQAFFATDKSPLGESTSMHFPVQGDGQFHFYEINLSKLKTWQGKLDVIRLDMVNGASEIGAKVEVDWIALYQAPARIVFGRPDVHRDEKAVTVSVPIHNAGGEASAKGLVVTALGENAKPVKLTKQVPPLAPGEKRNLTFWLPASRPTAYGYILVSAKQGKKLLFDARLNDPIAEDYAAVMAPKLALSWMPGFARIHARVDGAPIEMGWLRPFATLVYRDRSGAVHYEEVDPVPWALAAEQPRVLRSGSPGDGITWEFDVSDSRPEVTVACTLQSKAAMHILRFEGPRLLVQGKSQHAIFPGLQYLEANEPYTAAQFIGPKLADLRVPHPYKVAVPLMAIETKDGVVGMSWDPLQEWAPGHRLPCAQFEPDKGLMTIFAPSIPDFVEENQDFATTPYTLKPGEKMTLKMTFFSEAGKKITDVIPDYLKAHPLKRTMDSAKVEKVVETCFMAYAGTLYSKESKGWKSHFGLHLPYVFNAGYASRVLGESLRTGDPNLARKVGLDPNGQLAQYIGTTLDWFSDGAKAAADAAIARQSADGGFPYQIDDEMRKKVRDLAIEHGGIDVDTLGTIGETNSGLIARDLGGILDCAVRTGGKKYIDAGLKGLEKLNSFTVPRGAQTWEVHAHAPDVFAAGLAIDCNIAGYRLTGDEKYLDSAMFWARTGLPFVYTWTPPIGPIPAAVVHFDENGEGKNAVLDKSSAFYSNTKRYVNPGATIAVMGSSFYFVNWFGVPVQWCGLAWADSVQALMRLRKDAVLQSAADAVFASGAQQQFDKGWAAGTYPDSWGLASNTANTAFIAPETIIVYAYGALGEKLPEVVSTAAFRGPSGQSCLNSYARVESLSYRRQALTAELKLFSGQDVYSCITNIDSPSTVQVDGVELTSAGDLRAAPSGWLYDAENRALHIKYRSNERKADLRVSWRPTP